MFHTCLEQYVLGLEQYVLGLDQYVTGLEQYVTSLENLMKWNQINFSQCTCKTCEKTLEKYDTWKTT